MSPSHFKGDRTQREWRSRILRVAGQALAMNPTSIIDLGCGACLMHTVMPHGVKWIGYDIDPGGSGVRYCDFNESMPDALHSDDTGGRPVGVAAGIIEYIDDPEAFMQWTADNLIGLTVTYLPCESRIGDCQCGTWVNSMDTGSFLALVGRYWSAMSVTTWERQIVVAAWRQQ